MAAAHFDEEADKSSAAFSGNGSWYGYAYMYVQLPMHAIHERGCISRCR